MVRVRKSQSQFLPDPLELMTMKSVGISRRLEALCSTGKYHVCKIEKAMALLEFLGLLAPGTAPYP